MTVVCAFVSASSGGRLVAEYATPSATTIAMMPVPMNAEINFQEGSQRVKPVRPQRG
jgi:hypothetical protein